MAGREGLVDTAVKTADTGSFFPLPFLFFLLLYSLSFFSFSSLSLLFSSLNLFSLFLLFYFMIYFMIYFFFSKKNRIHAKKINEST